MQLIEAREAVRCRARDDFAWYAQYVFGLSDRHAASCDALLAAFRQGRSITVRCTQAKTLTRAWNSFVGAVEPANEVAQYIGALYNAPHARLRVVAKGAAALEANARAA